MLTSTVIVLFAVSYHVEGDDVGCSLTERRGRQGHCVQLRCCRHDYHVTDPDLCNGANEVCCYQDNICEDVGCSLTSRQGRQGHCVTRGCCRYDYHVSDPDLCTGPNQVCCYQDNICGGGGGPCFNVRGTWISRYRHSGSPGDIDAAFSRLKAMGINRVQFNVWADSNLYYESATARRNGVNVQDDRLQWAIDAGRNHGIQVYAWYEYGTMAQYGSNLRSFARECANKGWLLYNNVGGSRDYISRDPQAGQNVYLDPTLDGPMDFLRDMVLDAVRHYDLDGIQFDDHYKAPNGFDKLDRMSQGQKFSIMRSWMSKLCDSVKEIDNSVHVSFSPSPLGFARRHHNVDWSTWLRDDVVEELVPQYYRTTATQFQTDLDNDLRLVADEHKGFVPGIRLSGSSQPRITPPREVDQKLVVVRNRELDGVSFWFADDLIAGNYQPPNFNQC